jgi:two-component system phosphoglycerate transport system response regulator PgtA
MDAKSIVLVEDDMNLRQSIMLMLQRAGYFVSATDNIYNALDLIRFGEYMLIITDMNMPGTSGILLPDIQGNFPYISILVLTDHSSADYEKEGELFNAHYLVKPIAPERLLNFIEVILGNHNYSSRL